MKTASAQQMAAQSHDESTIAPSGSMRQERLSQAIDEFYAALDAGHSVDREQLLLKYADIADELRDCLHNLDFIQHISPELADRSSARADGTAALDSGRAHLGDFRILRELGRGGMGVVYEAEQLSLGRHVALKVLPFAAMLDKQQLARFKNEARAAATLDHPNIVAIHSVGCERGVHYYAMQLIEGRSLAQVVEQLRAESKERGARNEERETRSKKQVCSPPLDGEGLGEGCLDTAPIAHADTLHAP